MIIVAKVHAGNRADKKAKNTYTHSGSLNYEKLVKVVLDLFCDRQGWSVVEDLDQNRLQSFRFWISKT